jgi:alkanesulfonate monooxygenase SsuD/methylene tetrahydromethanopterin reductase-like flavin-dependent oxidoreductase (luciferase family)
VTRSPRVGISIVPYADSIDRIRRVLRVADEEGLRLVGIQDHPYQRRFLDTFALVATLLAETRRASPGQVGLLAREIVPLLSTPVPDRGGPSR